MEDSGSVLHEFAHNIVLVEDPIVNEISSTKIRSEMCQVCPLFLIILRNQIGMPEIPERCIILWFLFTQLLGRVTVSWCAQGHTVRYLLPDAVIDYIQKNELYCSM